jgi:hypothetical protein
MPEFSAQRPCRILSLDGGGAKGFYTLGVLKGIEGKVGAEAGHKKSRPPQYPAKLGAIRAVDETWTRQEHRGNDPLDCHGVRSCQSVSRGTTITHSV